MHQPRIKALIIHLERATARYPHVQSLLKELSLPSEIMKATDSQELSHTEISQYYQRHMHKPAYPFKLNKNEIACFLSHRKCWQAIIDQKLDAALILEDDTKLSADFNDRVNEILAVLKPGDFIRLPFAPDREVGSTVKSTGNITIIKPIPVGLRATAQIVTQDAARRLLHVTQKFDRPVDTTLQMSWITGLHPLSAYPVLISENSANLGGSTIQHNKSFKDKLLRELLRPVYRWQIRHYSQK